MTVDAKSCGVDVCEDLNHTPSSVDELDVISLRASIKPHNYISQLILEMEGALIQLNATNLTVSKLESMAILIYESMSISARNYHSVQHVFDILEHDIRLKDNPIAILAACFHDCIYYHLDGGLTLVQADILKGSFKVEGGRNDNDNSNNAITNDEQYQCIYKFFATDRGEMKTDETDLLPMVESIFGYFPSQLINITNDGLNEYLSALVAVRQLQDHLPKEILVQIACCIEATIPFRQVDPDTGKTHMDRLYHTMKDTARDYDLQLSDEEIVISVQRACLLSNSDVGNFGSDDRLLFVDNTWSLLPETNESLRNEYVYSVDHFHVALFKMYGFLGLFLQPEMVFHEFRGVPEISEVNRLTKECSNNLAFAKMYVGAKLLAMSLVSALAVLTGGDAPISLFTGDLRPLERRSNKVVSIPTKSQNNCQIDQKMTRTSVSDFLNTISCQTPSPPEDFLLKCNQVVYETLEGGRRSKVSFDTKRSPWAALLYAHIGDEALGRILKEHILYPMTAERAWILLRALPAEPIHFIANSMAKQAISRRDKILNIVSEVEESND
jgi:hypothetical protein